MQSQRQERRTENVQNQPNPAGKVELRRPVSGDDAVAAEEQETDTAEQQSFVLAARMAVGGVLGEHITSSQDETDELPGEKREHRPQQQLSVHTVVTFSSRYSLKSSKRLKFHRTKQKHSEQTSHAAVKLLGEIQLWQAEIVLG
jgi:hypothetical protein